MRNFCFNDRWWLPAILVLSGLLRVAASVYLGDHVTSLPGTADQVSYHHLALRVLTGHGFTFEKTWWPATQANEPTAHWSYLYTFYLVGVYAVFGPHPLAARVIQAVLVGILQPLVTFGIARRLFGKVVGLAAAAVNALYLYFIYYAATLMTEPFFITSVLGCLYLTIVLADNLAGTQNPRRVSRYLRLAVLLGVLLGSAILLRQLFLLILPFLWLWIWLCQPRKAGRVFPSLSRPLLAFLVSSAVIGLMILPFTAFNYARFHRFVLLNTNAGFAFYWANHPVHGIQFISAREMGNYLDLIPVELQALDEAALDQALLKLGLQFVVDDPGRYLLLSLSRIPEYFMFWPLPESGMISNITRVGSFGLAFPFMIAGIVLWLKSVLRPAEQKSPGFLGVLAQPGTLLLLFVGVYTVVHLLSWSLVRYRLPVDGVLIIFAALALHRLAVKLLPRTNHFKTGEVTKKHGL